MEFKNQYLTYSEYQEIGGKLQQMPFNLLEYRARKEIDKNTFGRFLNVNDYPQELKLCINELINEIQIYNDVGNKSSETVGSYSVAFNKPVSSEENKIFKNIIKSYLSNTKIDGVPVLYPGVDINDN